MDPSTIHLSTHLFSQFKHLSICPPTCQFMHPPLQPIVLTQTHWLTLFIYLPTQLSTHLPVHLSVHFYSLPSIHLLVHFSSYLELFILSIFFGPFTHLPFCTLPPLPPQHSCPSISLTGPGLKAGLPG